MLRDNSPNTTVITCVAITCFSLLAALMLNYSCSTPERICLITASRSQMIECLETVTKEASDAP